MYFSSKGGRTPDDPKWLVSLHPLLHKAPASLSFNQLLFFGKACLKHVPSLVWVCLSEPHFPGDLMFTQQHSSLWQAGWPHTLTNEGSKPTSSADF